MTLIAPAPVLYRMPYGRCDSAGHALRAVAAIGGRTVQWNLVLDDIADDADARGILRRAREGLARGGPGSILVAHADGRGHRSAVALRELLLYLRGEGYEPVTVSELLRRGNAPIMNSACFERSPGDNLVYDRRFPD
jgi:peptidoglycan/xylan/chitin deacetylase (PgdA/CDA1 family)